MSREMRQYLTPLADRLAAADPQLTEEQRFGRARELVHSTNVEPRQAILVLDLLLGEQRVRTFD